ncbi:MAG: heme exporter protein CcmD [Pseudomonadales bacterium]|nr:heme exporter protein CcmD [Pseudomonadales bacterium]
MYFDSIQALWSMGGHGAYVWIAYGVSLSIMVWCIISPLKDYRKQLKNIVIHAKNERD